MNQKQKIKNKSFKLRVFNKKGSILGSFLSLVLVGIIVLTLSSFVYTQNRAKQKIRTWNDLILAKENIAYEFYISNSNIEDIIKKELNKSYIKQYENENNYIQNFKITSSIRSDHSNDIYEEYDVNIKINDFDINDSFVLGRERR